MNAINWLKNRMSKLFNKKTSQRLAQFLNFVSEPDVSASDTAFGITVEVQTTHHHLELGFLHYS